MPQSRRVHEKLCLNLDGCRRRNRAATTPRRNRAAPAPHQTFRPELPSAYFFLRHAPAHTHTS